VNKETHQAADLPATISRTYADGRAKAVMAGQTYLVTSDNLRCYALWSAQPERYVCVEPTLAGDSFSEQPEGSPEEYLKPGEARTFGCSLGAMPS
jgi:galactose mutarotase-like enzyme